MAMSKEQDEQATPERWSAKAKTEVVLRLFRGESVEAVSREIQVPVHEVETWRKYFLESGQAGLKKRSGDPEERALRHTQAKVGELTMKLELAEMLLEKRGYGDELVKLKKSRGW
jgi:transposase